MKKLILTPSLSYYSKTGLGISATASAIREKKKLLPYQFYLTGSYDYIKNRKFITGISLTHFFTKDSLDFYTSPLTNEAYVYFTFRNFWLKPSISGSYGWGTRSGYQEREEYIYSLLLRPNGYTRINTEENITDINLTLSLRHDFYWMNVLASRDFIRLTPQFVFTSGTQQFGFNQTSNTYGKARLTGNNILYNTEEVYLDNSFYFQPLSLSAYIKTEYSRGKFFLQPQFLIGYYFPAETNNISTAFQLNAGVIF
ncbi:MAG TPA: hypothetical protein VHK91_01515 [Flavisolibacter sp.]|nr:hypothetical protein [Flavisolibacter sp.]